MARLHTRVPRNERELFNARLGRILKWIGFGEAALVLFLQPFRPVMVVGNSMVPSYRNFEVVVGKLNFGSAHRGDVVVFDFDEEPLIKRVAGTPGDVMSDGTIVPRNSYYVLGDNGKGSVDSRSFGPVNRGDVKMVVVYPTSSRPGS